MLFMIGSKLNMFLLRACLLATPWHTPRLTAPFHCTPCHDVHSFHSEFLLHSEVRIAHSEHSKFLRIFASPLAPLPCHLATTSLRDCLIYLTPIFGVLLVSYWSDPDFTPQTSGFHNTLTPHHSCSSLHSTTLVLSYIYKLPDIS